MRIGCNEITLRLIKQLVSAIIMVATSAGALFTNPAELAHVEVVEAKVEPRIEVKIKDNSNVEAMVREEFGDVPVMIEIAKCESKFRQWGTDGEALRGAINSHDRGIFQINETYHLNSARQMGIDILTVEGNIKYARYLYEQSGTQPWAWSRECWGGL